MNREPGRAAGSISSRRSQGSTRCDLSKMDSPVLDGRASRQRRQQRAATIVINNDFFSSVDAKVDTYNLTRIDTGSEVGSKASEYIHDCLKELLQKQVLLMEKIHLDSLNVEINSYDHLRDLQQTQTVAMKDKAKENHESNVQMISSISNTYRDQITSKTEILFSTIIENIKNFITQILDSRYAIDRFSLTGYKKRIREELYASRCAVDLFRQAYDDNARHLHMEKMRLLTNELDEKQHQTLDEMKKHVETSELKVKVWEKRVKDLEFQLESEKRLAENMQVTIKEKKVEKKSAEKRLMHEEAQQIVAIKEEEIVRLKDELETIRNESKAFECIKSELSTIIEDRNGVITERDKEIEFLRNDIIYMNDAQVVLELTNEDTKIHVSSPRENILDAKIVAYADVETMTEFEFPVEPFPLLSEALVEASAPEDIEYISQLSPPHYSETMKQEDTETVLSRNALEVNVAVQNINSEIDLQIIIGNTDVMSNVVINDTVEVNDNVQTLLSDIEEVIAVAANIDECTADQSYFSKESVKDQDHFSKESVKDQDPKSDEHCTDNLEPKLDKSIEKEEPEFISVLDMESIVSQGNIVDSSVFSLELDSQGSFQKPSASRPSSSSKIFPVVFTSSQVKDLLDKRQELERELHTKILSLEYQNSKLSNRIRSDESYFENQDMIHKLRLRERSLLLKALVEKVKVLNEKLDKDKFSAKKQKISNLSGLPIINMTERPQTGFINRSESAPHFNTQHFDLKRVRPSTSTAVTILKKIDVAGITDGPRLPITDDKVDLLFTDDIFDDKLDTLKSLGVLPLNIEDVNEIKDIRKQIIELLSSQKPHVPRNVQLATTLAAKTKMQGRSLHPKPFVSGKNMRNTSPQPRDVVVSPPTRIDKKKKQTTPF